MALQLPTSGLARKRAAVQAMGFCVLLISLGCLAAKAASSEPSANPAKPTSSTALREMSSDRPDATESPFTVDVGHIQIESDLILRGRDKADGDRTTKTQIGSFNLRFGMTPRTELGLFVSPYLRVVEKPEGGTEVRRSGFGDLVVRGKFNFWGNDGGSSALGAIVDVSLPTAKQGLGNERVQATVLIPIDLELSAGWSLGAMTGVELRRSHHASRYDPVLITTATVGHSMTESTNVYLELTSEAGEGTHVATFNTGMTLRVNANLQFDAGVNLALSEAATDSELFIGVARRF